MRTTRRAGPGRRARLAVAITVLLLVPSPAAAGVLRATTAPVPSRWFTSLDAAYLHAQQSRQPMLVFVGSGEVAASRDAWAGLVSADADLSPWTAVRLDADADRDVARSLGVVGVPTLLALASDGRTVATIDRPLAGRPLSAWLDEQRRRATTAAAAATTVAELVHRTGVADAAVREAAVRQLRDQSAAVPAVVDALATGSQQQRLAAADLLEAWHAPGMADVDPWAQATLTPARLSALRSWATSAKPVAATQPAADELDALAAAPTAIAAAAVRERLVRHGPPLLPQVVARLSADPPDPARGRLVALRYRLCATDRLAADWPGGFDRVASADVQVRRQAVAELAAIVRPDDLRLLTELFADADPFVREQALKDLRAVGGPETNRALVRLLADPEPNVRAAVLNTLADDPAPDLAGDVARFAAAEPDVDLVVHAVHVLELTPGDASFAALVSLLDHRQWRVRGEAAESLRGRITDGQASADQKAAAFAALGKRLDDPEGYVVTRAAQTMIKSGLGESLDRLMDAAGRRPDVARDVLRAIGTDADAGKPFIPRIRKLARGPQPGVRGAAVVALAQLDPDGCGTDVSAALADPDPDVRAAGLRAMMAVLKALEPNGAHVADWFVAFRRGDDRPGWMAAVVPTVRRMTATAGDPPSRVNAATILCALDQEGQAWPTLVAAAAQPDQAALVGPALPWVGWDHRLALFTAARRSAGAGQAEHLVEAFVTVPDDRAAGPLWDLLGADASSADLSAVLDPLRKLYRGSDLWSNDPIPPDRRAAAVAACRPVLDHGTDLQRTAALTVLLSVDPAEAATAATAVGDDPRSGEWLKLDALQVRLTALATTDPAAATAVAVAAVGDGPMAKVAVPFLAGGADAVGRLRGSSSLYTAASTTTVTETTADGSPIIVVRPPKGLTAGPVRAVLAAADGDLAGYAAYLLVLLGDQSAMDRLIAVARDHSMDETWKPLVYRAIASSDDASRVPVLVEIYQSMAAGRQFQIRDLYWTIRPMTGPAVLALRKRIRDEYGMTNLR